MMKSLRSIKPSETNVDTIPKQTLSERCQICGEENTKIGYGVRSCDSCKIFFRRNVQLDLSTQRCCFGEECNITINTRHVCRYCRLRKCFSVGMQKELIRAQHLGQGSKKKQNQLIKKINSNKNKHYPPVVISTLDLLRNDRSLLTIDQWSLLSNISNTYNNRTPIENIRHVISSQSNHLPKIRFKIASDNLMEIVGSMYLFIEPFIKIIPEFRTMQINDRTALIERNLRNLGGFNSLFSFRETNMLKDVVYSNGLLSTYGSWLFKETVKTCEAIDIDGTLIKLLIVILAFSTCCDVVYPEYNQNQSTTNPTPVNYILTNTIYLFQIQNIYTEIMFKYMLYRYGYNQAALRFAYLIQNFLQQGVMTANAAEISKHELMVQMVIDKAEQSLIIEDQLNTSTN